MLLLHGSPAPSNDVEMLQTDVMRFFAILCLCLMAIFALVKTLPMAPPADRPTIAEPIDLKAEAQSLQIQIATLKKKLTVTLTQVQAASVAAEQSTMQVNKTAKDEQEILTRLSNTQRELKIVTESLNQTRRELKIRARKLAGLVNDIDTKQQIQSGLRSHIKAESQNLKKIRAALDRVNQKINQSHPQYQPIPPKPSKTDSSKTPADDGYILRFASDAGLQTLISGGQVIFYAVAGKKAWQLRFTGGRPGYISAEIPPQIYEMETATVPIEYAAAFQQQVAAFGRSAVAWGVTLPVQTTASINRLIKGQHGGDLVIMPDGEVILN
jgi:uncharacterized protein YlxW (UPF0749 family)